MRLMRSMISILACVWIIMVVVHVFAQEQRVFKEPDKEIPYPNYLPPKDPATGEQGINSGYVAVDGVFIPRPYYVTVKDDTILINNIVYSKPSLLQTMEMDDTAKQIDSLTRVLDEKLPQVFKVFDEETAKRMILKQYSNNPYITNLDFIERGLLEVDFITGKRLQFYTFTLEGIIFYHRTREQMRSGMQKKKDLTIRKLQKGRMILIHKGNETITNTKNAKRIPGIIHKLKNGTMEIEDGIKELNEILKPPVAQSIIDNLDSWPKKVLSHSLSPIWQSSSPLPTEPPIERIEIQGYNERILDNNVMLSNACGDVLGMTNVNFEGKHFEHEDIIPGGDPLSYYVDVLDIVDSLLIICNWDTIIGQPVTLEVRDPTDKLVYEEKTEIPPIKPPIFDDPLAGIWKMDVLADDTGGKKFVVATVAGVIHEPLVDCFIGEEDIWFTKESPELGDVFHVLVTTHAGDQFDTGVKSVLVKCYLGDPEDDIQIGGWHWAMNIEPGSFDTTCYQFNSEICAEVSPCEITVVVDPRNELEEYDEDNNVASKVITFEE